MRVLGWMAGIVVLAGFCGWALGQATAPTTKPKQETHKEVGVVVTIDTVKMAFTLERELEPGGQKTNQNYIYHKVKEPFFKDLKPGDTVEVIWYNKSNDIPIASTAKVLSKAEEKK